MEEIHLTKPYKERVERYGPPLDYVGDKLDKSLLSQHEAWRYINKFMRDYPMERGQSGAVPSIKEDFILGPARHGFYMAVVAYAALYDCLEQLGDVGKLVDHLLGAPREDLKLWIDNIYKTGSVKGIDNQE